MPLLSPKDATIWDSMKRPVQHVVRHGNPAYIERMPWQQIPFVNLHPAKPRMKDTLLINYHAGPGAGKSTNAAGTFAELKRRGHTAELATEYAKDCVWRNAPAILDDQIYVFAKQRNRIKTLWGKVDFIVTDSPLILSLAYMPYELRDSVFGDLVREQFLAFESLDVFVHRTKPYVSEGRLQTEAEARAKDDLIRGLLDASGRPYHTVADSKLVPRIVADRAELYVKGPGPRGQEAVVYKMPMTVPAAPQPVLGQPRITNEPFDRDHTGTPCANWVSGSDVGFPRVG